MRVVLDTNILWVSIPPKSPSNWLVRYLQSQRFSICVTTDILQEYEEIIGEFLGVDTAQNFMEFLDVIPNLDRITKHIRWQLIEQDPDDDKFADCYLWGNANYLVTHDRHFNILKKRGFPKINVVTLEDFKKIIERE